MTIEYRKLSFAGFYLFAGGIPFSLLPPQIGIFFAFLGWLLEGFIRKNWQFKSHPILWVLVVYWGWNLIASALSERPIHSLLAVFDNEWMVLIFLMMYWVIQTKDELLKIIWTLVLFSVPAFLYGIIQSMMGIEYIKGVELLKEEGQVLYKAVGFHGFWLTYAAFGMIVMFLAIAIARTATNKRNEIIGYIVSLMSLAAVYVTYARSIWLGMTAGLMTSFFFLPKKISLTIIISGMVILTALYITCLLYTSDAADE